MRHLAVSLLIFIAVAVAAMAQPSPTGMLGPITPARAAALSPGTVLPVDDPPIIPFRSVGNTFTLSNPWETAIDANNTFTLSNLDAGGMYLTATRVTNQGLTQSVTITGFASNGTPNTFAFSQTGGTHGPQTGTAALTQTGGKFDGAQISSSTTPLSVTIPFIFIDTNGDGFGDFVSIPWSYAGLLGVDTSKSIMGTLNPQIWVPLADTDGDGKPDAVVVDLNGDGVPDPDLHQGSPGSIGPVAAPPTLPVGTPTLSEWAMLLLVLTLAAVALWQLRRLQPPAAGV